MNIWWINLIFYLLLNVAWLQLYKIATKKVKKDGAITTLLELIGAGSILVVSLFFNFKFPTNIWIYVLFGIAIIFYALNDRLQTTVRKNLEVSVVSILMQLSNVFVFIWGILFFKETFMLQKAIGAILIVIANVFLFYKKGKFVFNRYTILSFLSSIALSIAVSLDAGISGNFNLAFYAFMDLFGSAILISLVERIKPRDMLEEYKQGNKKAIIATGMVWGLYIFFMLRTYNSAPVTTVAPLGAVAVILNVIASYIFMKERNNIGKKIIAAILVILGVILVTIA